MECKKEKSKPERLLPDVVVHAEGEKIAEALPQHRYRELANSPCCDYAASNPQASLQTLCSFADAVAPCTYVVIVGCTYSILLVINGKWLSYA